jgi:hypothetical protein
LTHNSTRPQVCSTLPLPRRGAVAKRSRAQVATTPRPRAGNAKSTTLRVAAFVPFCSRYHLPPARQCHRLIETRRAPAFVSNAKFSAISQKNFPCLCLRPTNKSPSILLACLPPKPTFLSPGIPEISAHTNRHLFRGRETLIGARLPLHGGAGRRRGAEPARLRSGKIRYLLLGLG